MFTHSYWIEQTPSGRAKGAILPAVADLSSLAVGAVAGFDRLLADLIGAS